jgi:hypothetical protein
MVKGKGRPKGSKGNEPRAKKGTRYTSMYTTIRIPNFSILI